MATDYGRAFGGGASNSGDPIAELNAWKAYRQQFESQFGTQGHQAPPELLDRYNGKDLSPEAWKLYHAGNGDQHYDLNTGGLKDNRGYWSHWESYLPLMFGGAVAAPLIAGAMGASAGAGGATSGALGTGATAGELGIPTTMGIADGAGIGTAAAMPSMADLGGLLAGGGLPEMAAGGASAAKGAFGLDDKWSPLLKALAAAGGYAGGKIAGNNAMEHAVPSQLNQMLDLAISRMNAQQPLFEASNKGLYDMLPTFAKKGRT